MKIFKIFCRNFSNRNNNINRFANLTKDIKYENQKTNMEVYNDNLPHVMNITIYKKILKLQVKNGPKEGEYFSLPTYPSKNFALQHGYMDAFKRDPVSAYYSMQVNQTTYHVFNAARVVRDF